MYRGVCFTVCVVLLWLELFTSVLKCIAHASPTKISLWDNKYCIVLCCIVNESVEL